jgi:hypothetical protein
LKADSSYHLHLDTHISTAFVAGYFIQTEKRKYKIILNGAAAVASFLLPFRTFTLSITPQQYPKKTKTIPKTIL